MKKQVVSREHFMVTEMRVCLCADGKISAFKGGKGGRGKEGTEKGGKNYSKSNILD